MKIAELFVSLGVKGKDASMGALKGVRSGLDDVRSMSLEAKAGILAVVYGLEQMMSQSAQAGTGLTNFNALTGMNVQMLQKWQWAAQQAGVSGDELTASMKGVQNSVTGMLTGKAGIEGYAMVANKVGLDPKRLRDTEYVMQQLQKFAQSVPQDVGNQQLKSFGLSEGTIAAMRRNAFSAENFQKAPAYSNNEVSQLDKVNVAWSNLGTKIKMAFGHFTARDGMSLVNDITKITTQVIRLTEALVTLGEKMHVFDALAKIVGFLSDAVESKPGTTLGETHLETKAIDGVKNWFKSTLDAKNSVDPWSQAENEALASAHRASPFSGAPAGNTQNINVNITHHGDAKDTKAVKDVHKSAIQHAYRQKSAQSQGS